MRRAGTAHSTVPAARGRAEAAPRAVANGAPVTVRHGTGREPRAPACSETHTRGIDLRRALVVIKWVYTARSLVRGPETRRGGFCLPEHCRYPLEAEEIVRSDGLA